MDDQVQQRNMILAGIFMTAMIGMMVWQILRLLSKGGLDALAVVRLAVSVFVLGIMCYVAYTAFSLWT